MKKIILLLFIALAQVACNEIEKNTQIERPLRKVNYPCDTNINKAPKKSTSFGIDNDEEKVVYLRRAKYIVYQNLKTKKYSIKVGNKLFLKDLNYFAQIGNAFQVLNNKNEIDYYDLSLKKIVKSKIPESKIYFCGNVPCWKLEIKKKDSTYIVNKIAGFSGSYANAKWEVEDSIPAENIEDIHFIYHDKILEYDDNVRASEIIIIKYKDYQAIRIDKKSFYFDSIDTSNNIKVQCNGLFGYFGISKVKYKTLGIFEFNLAPFQLEDGAKGYLDRLGNEFISNKELEKAKKKH